MKSVSARCDDTRTKPRLPTTRLQDLMLSEVAAFLEAVRGTRLEALWHLAASGEFRIAELLSLRWSDVDFASRSISVRHAVVGVHYEALDPSPMAPQAREVGFGIDLAERMRTRLERQQIERSEWGAYYSDHDLVFCKENGAPIHPRMLFDAFIDVSERAPRPQVARGAVGRACQGSMTPDGTSHRGGVKSWPRS